MQKIGSFSLIERVILSAGAMLIFSVSFQIDQMPEGENMRLNQIITLFFFKQKRASPKCQGSPCSASAVSPATLPCGISVGL